VRDALRLPQDVGPASSADARGVPDLTKLQAEVGEYLTIRVSANDHDARALGCWGLVARWPMSRNAIASLLQSSREEDIEDAAGILGRVGVPTDMLPTVITLIDAFPDSPARDCLVRSLPVGHPRRTLESVPAGRALRALHQVPLRGGWEPYTGRIQFLEAPFQHVAKEFSRWMRQIQPRSTIQQHSGSLAPLLALLDPYWFPTKRLLVELGEGWTAVFSNGHDTYEASVLSERMRVRGVVSDFAADVVQNGEVRNYGNVMFELINDGKSVRTVQVSRQESGWVAYLLGSALPFEDMERYRARIKRERFDLEMLNRYCAALGIARSDDRLYGPHALLHSEQTTANLHPSYPDAAAWRAAHLSTK